MLGLDFRIQAAGEAGQKPWGCCQTTVLTGIHGPPGRCRDRLGFGNPKPTLGNLTSN